MASNMDAGSSSSAPLQIQPEEKGPPPTPRPSVSRERLPLPKPKYGELITVLSIDGGGIRGLIPAVVLQKLEEKLQLVEKEDDPDVNTENIHIADYFDVIAGTSMGGLIAAMLVTPDDNRRPKYTPQEIKEFYTRHGPEIFPPKRWWWHWPGMGMARAIMDWGPKYDGTFLQGKIREVTGDTTLGLTLSTIVVPTFDVNRMEPINFSSYSNPQALLSDVCIGTSATPTYFPAHPFDEYHLIDGGVAANNPTMAAISSVTREQLLGNQDFHALDYKKYLVISIGTGSATVNEKGLCTGDSCAKLSDLNWVVPFIGILSPASALLVDRQVSMLLHNTVKQYYLRIQGEASLFREDMLSMDDATPDHMDKLVDIGEKLLEQKVARVDLTMGVCQLDEDVPTNDAELRRFARLLVSERKLRLRNEKE